MTYHPGKYSNFLDPKSSHPKAWSRALYGPGPTPLGRDPSASQLPPKVQAHSQPRPCHTGLSPDPPILGALSLLPTPTRQPHSPTASGPTLAPPPKALLRLVPGPAPRACSLVHFLTWLPFLSACRLSLQWKLSSQNSANQMLRRLLSSVRLEK